MSGQGASLVEQIASAASCSPEVVEQVLSDYGLNLTTSVRHHRSVRLDRLRIRGEKAGGVEPGPFDRTFAFDLGVTVIAADNLRGKTSILEVLTLVLRGELSNLQADVQSWLKEVSLDVHINGQPIGFRLSLEASEITEGHILAGTIEALTASDDSIAEAATELTTVHGGDQWADQVGAFMMSQLGLEEMQVFNRARNDDEAGVIKSHGWPSYFGVLYPPSGADKVLLGSTAGDYLPVRLMQVFLDMPEATRSMRVRALAQRLESEFKADERRGRDANDAVARRLEEAKARQANAEARLGRLRDQAPAESLHELAGLAAAAGGRVAAARQAAEAAATAFGEAQVAQVADERALNGLRESKAASALFHGLDPQFCPRCETPISDQRRSREHDEHQCAVCDTTLYADEEDDYAEREAQALQAFVATRAATNALDAARNKSQADLDTALTDLKSIDQRIAQAQGVHQTTERIEAEHELAAATAVAEALEAMTPEQTEPPAPVVVLGAASEILKSEIAQASASLYTELSDATRDLALSFGISELESIKIKANGNMDVTKGGGARSSFSAQSPGERLRLRYALVVALLRTARGRGIAGHPGLLLLDSLKAEEVQDDHAQTLLQGLVTAAAEEPGLQILVTTADKTLAASVPGVAGNISPEPGQTTIF
ncbi:hypothetical protein [Promicromonospora sp. NPDC057488]|uniref:hypothetical protein n=1 Tax=Promicromonospora sp. NPDC057488 TaxID=3346147 RepID=UPI00366F5B73